MQQNPARHIAMSARILITRAEDDAQETAVAVQALGYETLIDPILRLYPETWQEPDWQKVSAIILTSHNALRGFGEHRLPRDKLFFLVGARSAAELRKLGYIHVTATVEKSHDLAFPIRMQLRPEEGVLLHLTSEHTHNAFYEPLREEGYTIEARHVYRAEEAKALQPATLAALAEGKIDAVLFYSARTAAIFHQLIHRHGATQSLQNVQALCLSDSVAAACEKSLWKNVLAAGAPTQGALLDCLAKALPSAS